MTVMGQAIYVYAETQAVKKVGQVDDPDAEIYRGAALWFETKATGPAEAFLITFDEAVALRDHLTDLLNAEGIT